MPCSSREVQSCGQSAEPTGTLSLSQNVPARLEPPQTSSSRHRVPRGRPGQVEDRVSQVPAPAGLPSSPPPMPRAPASPAGSSSSCGRRSQTAGGPGLHGSAARAGAAPGRGSGGRRVPSGPSARPGAAGGRDEQGTGLRANGATRGGWQWPEHWFKHRGTQSQAHSECGPRAGGFPDQPRQEGRHVDTWASVPPTLQRPQARRPGATWGVRIWTV